MLSSLKQIVKKDKKEKEYVPVLTAKMVEIDGIEYNKIKDESEGVTLRSPTTWSKVYDSIKSKFEKLTNNEPREFKTYLDIYYSNDTNNIISGNPTPEEMVSYCLLDSQHDYKKENFEDFGEALCPLMVPFNLCGGDTKGMKASDIQKFIALGNINKDGVIKHGAKNPEDRSFERIGINKLNSDQETTLNKLFKIYVV